MNGLIEETYAERTLPREKVNPFTSGVSWEMDEEENWLQERFYSSTRQTNYIDISIYICKSLKLVGSFSKEKKINIADKKQAVHPEDHMLKPMITKAAVVQKLHYTNDNDD